MTELSRLASEALDSVEIEITDFYSYGAQWRIGETGFAIATIKNNTGLILRNFYAFAHEHGNNLVRIFDYYGCNFRFVDELSPSEEITLVIAMQARSSGGGTVHLHFDAEFAKLKYDDVTISYKVEPD